MKVIQTFWLKPFFETKREKGLHQACGWCNPMSYYMSHALSCLSLREYYDQVELYTDPAGKKLLIDDLQLPYTAVHLLPKELDGYPVELWALGKIYAYRDQQDPFLHVDNDVYVWQRFPEAIEQAQIVAQNYEQGIAFNRANVLDVMSKAVNVPPYMRSMKTADEANVGIIGGRDVAFFQHYADEALRFVRGNMHILGRLRYPYYFNTIFEQYLFTCLAAGEEKEITYAFRDVDDHFSQMVRFDQVPFPQWYIHTCGPWKKAEWVGDAVTYHLHARFPKTYRRVAEWYEAECAEGEESPAHEYFGLLGQQPASSSAFPARLSIVIPAWNAELFIGRCLKSLRMQTYTDWEAIVVDDGSSDDTVMEVERFVARDNRIRLIRQEHGGVSVARNKGLDVAHGELIAFVDADDYMHPQYLELMVQALDQHDEADMSMTLSVRTPHSTDASLSQRHGGMDGVAGDGSILRKALFLGHRNFTFNQCHTCHGKLFRRRLLDGLTFPEKYAVYEDAVFMNRVFQRIGQFVMVRQRLYFWVQHPWSTLATAERGLLQGVQAYIDCLDAIPAHDRQARAACLQRIFIHAAWLLRRKEKGELKAVSVSELHQAVRIPVRVKAALLLASCTGIRMKWQLLQGVCSRKARQRMETLMDEKLVGRDQQAVGKAPQELNGLVSVIVPIYNVEDCLPGCLDSIVSQRYANLEIILVDDGSTDSSGAICDEYASRDSRIKVIHQENQGLSGARNSGMEQATGEYVFMPDGDDTIHPQMIYLLHKALQQGDFPFAMSCVENVEQSVVADRMPELPAHHPLRLLSQRDLFAALQENNDSHVVWNKLYRHAAIRDLRFEDTAGEDTVFNTRLYLHTTYAVLVDIPLYYWLQRSNSLSRNLETMKGVQRLASFKRCADLTAKTEYEGWFLALTYRHAIYQLDQYRCHQQYQQVCRSVRTIVRQTARRLLNSGSLPLEERLRLLFTIMRKCLF